jgi:hypothetical protein
VVKYDCGTARSTARQLKAHGLVVIRVMCKGAKMCVLHMCIAHVLVQNRINTKHLLTQLPFQPAVSKLFFCVKLVANKRVPYLFLAYIKLVSSLA